MFRYVLSLILIFVFSAGFCIAENVDMETVQELDVVDSVVNACDESVSAVDESESMDTLNSVADDDNIVSEDNISNEDVVVNEDNVVNEDAVIDEDNVISEDNNDVLIEVFPDEVILDVVDEGFVETIDDDMESECSDSDESCMVDDVFVDSSENVIPDVIVEENGVVRSNPEKPSPTVVPLHFSMMGYGPPYPKVGDTIKFYAKFDGATSLYYTLTKDDVVLVEDDMSNGTVSWIPSDFGLFMFNVDASNGVDVLSQAMRVIVSEAPVDKDVKRNAFSEYNDLMLLGLKEFSVFVKNFL